jgi:hypothetical protein
MIKDIKIPNVQNVTLAVVREKDNLLQDEWRVHLINNNSFPLENALVASSGYGEKQGENQRTSTLRHFLQTVPAYGTSLIEPLDSKVLHLTNEYWVSYYVGSQIYDKKFLFVPDSICEANLTFIKALNLEGVLHS